MGWLEKFLDRGDAPALLTGGTSESITYRDLANGISHWQELCRQSSIGPGTVVGFPARYNVSSVSLLFALAELKAVAVPLPTEKGGNLSDLLSLAAVDFHVADSETLAPLGNTPRTSRHELYNLLVERDHPGLVLFTSGTSGVPKAAVHDLEQLCHRYRTPRTPARVMGFMQLDHIGGINTILYILSHGGTLISPPSRTPHDVCQTIAQHKVEVLPVSPTFLNMMLMSGAFEQHDLSSLKRVTYGSEPMPESVLVRLSKTLPNVELLQTYGTTEIGILKSQSRDNSSLWMRVGGDGFETKIVDGRLWVKAEIAMLGYLNAPSPFDADGFMDTGDQVECHGEWLRILGRKSESINVGGNKVSPVEVESVLLEMPNVLEAAVASEPHPLTGRVVTAQVRLSVTEPPREFKQRMREFCAERLPSYAVPVKVAVVDTPLVTDRFKRSR